MKPVKLQSFQIGYGDDQVVIHPRLASVQEVEEVQQKLTDISDSAEDRFDLEFDVCKEALDAFSAQPAEKFVRGEKGKLERVAIEGGLAAHFAERSVQNERVVRQAYKLVINQMSPEVNFI